MSKKLTGTKFFVNTTAGASGPASETADAYETWFEANSGANVVEIQGIQTISEHGASDALAERKTLKDGVLERFVVGRDYGTISFTAYRGTSATVDPGIARIIAVHTAALGQDADEVFCAFEDPQSGTLGGELHFFKGTVSNVVYSESNPDDLAMISWDINVNGPFYVKAKS